MRAHLGNKHRDRFDIKADEGGITDIEFITQYLLRYAHEKPKLTRWSDNVHSGTTGAKRHYGRAGSDGADPCYTMRDELHHLALQELPGHVGGLLHRRA
ncbi:Bifunctional glutamine synthetase adenylyltransferase/adenylyl-removing enzyme [Escherichia coli]|uniref:hypothetical protein n=1 Tax=Escherichia coli TaxID=562 RepID=UPI000F2D961F|nr:hypothetical protein [Escherichia coli]VCY17287.1 Bifunctional glutamine synthetase adenylyltransferase/adenylyl-removing enzyme [Escherichia coli]